MQKVINIINIDSRWIGLREINSDGNIFIENNLIKIAQKVFWTA